LIGHTTKTYLNSDLLSHGLISSIGWFVNGCWKETAGTPPAVFSAADKFASVAEKLVSVAESIESATEKIVSIAESSVSAMDTIASVTGSSACISEKVGCAPPSIVSTPDLIESEAEMVAPVSNTVISVATMTICEVEMIASAVDLIADVTEIISFEFPTIEYEPCDIAFMAASMARDDPFLTRQAFHEFSISYGSANCRRGACFSEKSESFQIFLKTGRDFYCFTVNVLLL